MVFGNGVQFLVHDLNPTAPSGAAPIAMTFAIAAKWSTLRDFAIFGNGLHAAGRGTGIDVKAHGVRLENVRIHQLNVGVQAVVPGLDLKAQRWRDLRVTQCNMGVELGTGTSEGLYAGFEVSSVTPTTVRGIWEGSNMGSAHVGHSITTYPSTPRLKVNRFSNRSTFMGVYVEISPTTAPKSTARRMRP